MITPLTQSSVSTSQSSVPPAANTPAVKNNDNSDAGSMATASSKVFLSVSPEGRIAALMNRDTQGVADVANSNCPDDMASSTSSTEEPPVQSKTKAAADLDTVLYHLGSQGKQALAHVNALGSKIAERVSEIVKDVKESPEFGAVREQASEIARNANVLKKEVVGQTTELKNEVKNSHQFQELREYVKKAKDKVYKAFKELGW